MEAMVKAGGDEDMGDGMQCSLHPYRNNPGGICAFCLQDKLGKLLSSSLPILPPSSSSSPSSPPSFRSHHAPPPPPPPPASSSSSSSTSRPSASVSSLSLRPSASAKNEYYTRRPRLPFLLTKKKKKKKKPSPSPSSAAASSDHIIFKRSKSTAAPRRSRGPFLDDTQPDLVIEEEEGFSPRSKRTGFWSFLHLSSKSSVSANKSFRDSNSSPRISINLHNGKQKDKCSASSSSSLGKKSDIAVEDHDTPDASASASASSFERKVSRSRSVGCGSRSFSGDFFERISTGFGDCALRRVESQREGKPKVAAVTHRHSMKERVKCGGLFSGFMLHSSSSSSSSSSYLVSSSNDENNVNAKSAAVAYSHGRAGRNWGWAFASPMRAFTTKLSSKDVKNAAAAATPNLSAIPSLLAVRG